MSGMMNTNSTDWDRIRRSQLRVERHRLIKEGKIIPAYAMQPQMMAKNEDGAWVAVIRTFEE